MNTTPRTLLCTLTTALALGFVSSAFAADVAPRWQAAIAQLEGAKAEIKKGQSHGGKKGEALQKIDEAIALLQGDVEEIQQNKDKRAEKKAQKQ
jgi:hypothetical protein